MIEPAGMPNVQVTVGGAVHGLTTPGQVTRCDEEPTGPLAVAGQVTGYGESDHALPSGLPRTWDPIQESTAVPVQPSRSDVHLPAERAVGPCEPAEVHVRMTLRWPLREASASAASRASDPVMLSSC